MRSKTTYALRRALAGLALCLAPAVAWAQAPTPTPQKPAETKAKSSTPKAEGESDDYTVTSSIELGYRGLRVDGDINKYQSDLNYKAGPRLFDTSFLMQAKENRRVPLDNFLVTATGWGADPYGQMRISAEKSHWYRFDGSYRQFTYFRFLNNFANPNFATRPTDPATGQHGLNTRRGIGDFDLTILPKNRRVRFSVGFSPESYSGPFFTTWHYGGDDFMLLSQARSHSNDYRVGADWRLGPVDFSLMQGFRRFRDQTFIDNDGVNQGANPAPSSAFLTSIERIQPTRGSVNYTRFSAHTLLAKKLDITGRIVYSNATTNFNLIETLTAINFNTRITNIPGVINPPNILTLGQFGFKGDTKRPNTLGDLGLTYAATRKLRLSNTFRVETFQLNGGAFYNGLFNLTRSNGTGAVSIVPSGSSYEVTKYRKLQNTVEADYQFDENYSAHVGYRYGTRLIERFASGANLANNGAPIVAPTSEEEQNHTNVFIGGFRARPLKNWTLSIDAERGTADNVFTRVGNYDYTNIRARSRYAMGNRLRLNLAIITKNNSNPSVIDGVSLADFGVDVRSRVFTSSVDWTVNPRLSLSTGYNYNRQTSDAVVDYFFNSVRHPNGHSLYFMRNHFFFLDMVSQPFRRVTFYAAYRVNKDTGQGDRLADPTGTPGTLISSYPMSYQSPEGRVAIRLNHRLDWNLGYQYYNYRESPLVSIRPQNYHAHMPYTSLRFYFGGGER
ncbi:MAG: hypothetical protein ACJ74T_19275 [Pyrinomonadaceae bacterium]